ncbi:class I adenylate-forming enzyme family protein [Actinocorallia sp. A-T 12471]|uniref:class I adenylate-forming enzyme family protein n=1 Tax=Actinocorallia sp. A-T 12471 TaxID=3089813 RepID=UPI0029CC786F|nr:class I adenylate-forming enzyme family protein [Actinocorallia sp. A-T 12471]MDX6741463.1 class I adenylate-forming enzyme family protein [Actinocorallia sp. A-T 12471]
MPSELHGPALETLQLARLPMTLGGFLTDVAERHGAREALVFDDPLLNGATVRWTYTELAGRARAVARGLLRTGVRPGARVAILMANRPEAVAALFGTALAGAVAVPLSTFATRRELGQMLALAEVETLLMQGRMGGRDLSADVAALDPAPRRVVVLGPDDARSGSTSWDAFLADGAEIPDHVVDDAAASVGPDDPGLVLFSSGTTASAKGMLHRHRAPVLQFWIQARLFGRHPGTRMWTALPMFWTAGMNTAMGATLAAGGCWIMQEGFDAGVALGLMARERATEPYTLPHQARAMAEHPDWPTTDLSSLRCVYGKSVFSRHPTVTGDPAWQMPVGWGMSETCAFVCAHPSDSSRETLRGSLGRLMPGQSLRVVDPVTGEVLPTGEVGELAVKGATLMLRYLGKEPAECFDADGWFRTGDTGSVDADEQVHWSGRRTEMIKTGGANVAPAEIETQLRAHPGVRVARVLALPDERLEQIPVLCLEMADGVAPDPAEVTAFLRGRLASYKVPKKVFFFAPGEIPMTAGGTKVVDEALYPLLYARLTAQESP